MTKFRKNVLSRVIWFVAAAVVAAAAYFTVYSVTGSMERLDDFIRGFNAGVFTGVEGVCIIGAVYYALTLRNEEKLKKLFIDENDERTLLIQQKSGAAAFSIIAYSLLLATIVSGFFSRTVFFTLLAAVVFMFLTRIGMVLYYKHQLN